MEKSTLIRIINEEIQKVLKEFSLEEEELNEMATFYKIKGDKKAAKDAISKAKEKYREGTALYNTLDTLEKEGEIDYKKLSQETGKDVATYNNPKSRGVLEKDLANHIEAESGTRGRKADPNKPKKTSTGKKGRTKGDGTTTSKKKKSSSTSKLEKKYYVDADGEGPSSKELRDLASSGVASSQLNQLQQQEKEKMIKDWLKTMRDKGIVDDGNKILDKGKYQDEWAKAKPEIEAAAKNIK